MFPLIYERVIMYGLMLVGKYSNIFHSNTPEITIFTSPIFQSLEKKRKLREIIYFGLGPLMGRHSVLGYQQFSSVNLARLF